MLSHLLFLLVSGPILTQAAEDQSQRGVSAVLMNLAGTSWVSELKENCRWPLRGSRIHAQRSNTSWSDAAIIEGMAQSVLGQITNVDQVEFLYREECNLVRRSARVATYEGELGFRWDVVERERKHARKYLEELREMLEEVAPLVRGTVRNAPMKNKPCRETLDSLIAKVDRLKQELARVNERESLCHGVSWVSRKQRGSLTATPPEGSKSESDIGPGGVQIDAR